jgi:hypothetical protein
MQWPLARIKLAEPFEKMKRIMTTDGEEDLEVTKIGLFPKQRDARNHNPPEETTT